MENNKVVKALECFIGTASCKGNCPFDDTPECFECTATPKKFYKSILEIIHRQKAEIVELQRKNLELQREKIELQSRVKEMEADYESKGNN